VRRREVPSYDDYFIVVDLEWPNSRIEDYGNKKGWVLVCALISPYQDIEIADAGDDFTSIREAYVINEALFICIQAAPARIQKHPLKTGNDAVRADGGGWAGGGVTW